MNSLSSSTTHQDKPTKITSQAAVSSQLAGLLAMAGILVLAAWNGRRLSSSSPVFFFFRRDSQALESPVLARVSCRRQLSERRVFPGEKVKVKLQIANRKPLPLPWIQIDDEILKPWRCRQSAR